MVFIPLQDVWMKLHLQSLRLDLPDSPLEIDAVLDGPLTGIWGPSGIGKTSLLEAIAGLRPIAAGRIVLGDAVMTDYSRGFSIPSHRRPIGYAPQDMALFPHLNVRQNLLYGRVTPWMYPHREYRRAGVGEDHPTFSEVVDLLEMSELLDRPILGLSGGERQRVALGRALLAPAQLWLLDEPLSSLDQSLRYRVLDRLRMLVKSLNRTVVYVSHEKAEMTRWCQNILEIAPGRQIRSAPIFPDNPGP